MKFTQATFVSIFAGMCVVAALVTIGLSVPSKVAAQTIPPTPKRSKAIPRSSVLRIVAILEKEGVAAREITGQVDGRYLQALKRVMRARGAADVAVFEIGSANGINVMIVRFDVQAALERVVKSKQPLVRVEDCLVLPVSESNDGWIDLSKALVTHGGVENPLAVLEKLHRARSAALTLVRLTTLRSHIELYSFTNNNAVPDFKNFGWKQLIEAEHYVEPPMNELCEAKVASNLVVIDTPGADGRNVQLTKAGWVWNSADRTMHAAGMSDDQLTNIMKENDLDTAEWLLAPEQVIHGMLGETRMALSKFHLNQIEQGNERIATLRELVDGQTSIKTIPQNPFNGSAKVQAAKWNERKPPISANQEAGWNYDEVAGRFWANTNVVGENAW